MGATDCQYFSSTTVPATDTTPPATWDGVWTNGDYAALRANPGSFIYHIPLGAQVIAVSSGMDDGGVSKVTTATEEGWLCCSGNICSSTGSLSSPTIATQDGSIGSTVSNGVWTGLTVQAHNFCNAGFTLTSYRFAWTTTAEDFHGNKTVGSTQQIVYP
ncbi:MAG TPA: hypothetical protein VF469_33725 [Kofleriaceae bacterium]